MLGVIYRFFPFFHSVFSPQAEMELKESRIVKYQKRIKADSGLEILAENLKKSLKKAEEGVLRGKTPSLAAVQIQEVLQGIMSKSGVVIQRLQILKPEKMKEDGYLSIPVEFYMQCSIPQLKEVLYRIGTYQKYLTVEALRIDSIHQNLGRTVKCRVTVAGYMKTTRG